MRYLDSRSRQLQFLSFFLFHSFTPAGGYFYTSHSTSVPSIMQIHHLSLELPGLYPFECDELIGKASSSLGGNKKTAWERDGRICKKAHRRLTRYAMSQVCVPQTSYSYPVVCSGLLVCALQSRILSGKDRLCSANRIQRNAWRTSKDSSNWFPRHLLIQHFPIRKHVLFELNLARQLPNDG